MKSTVAKVIPMPELPALRAALIAAFPSAARCLHTDARVSTYAGGAWLALSQEAWTNVSFGWQADDNLTPSRSSDVTYEACPLGGRFIKSVVSIGD